MANKKVFNPLGMPFDTVRDDIADLTTRNASDVVNTPAGDIVATNVQTAINELDTEKVPYTGGTGNVDIGDFELRAQTLESDVATGTAPFTIASTTVNTNLNADLLDGLHDTSFAKTTAGQTINVATAAELTAALAALASAPSLLGNIVIQVNANITIDISVPALLYNGYSLTIQGAMTKLDDTINMTNVTPVYNAAGNWGTLTRTAGTWTAGNRDGLLCEDIATGYKTILAYNSATIAYHAMNGTYFPTGARNYNIYDWTYTITGLVTTAPYSTVYFKNLKFINATQVFLPAPFSTIFLNECRIEGSSTSPVFYTSSAGYTGINQTYLKGNHSSYCCLVGNTHFIEGEGNVFYVANATGSCIRPTKCHVNLSYSAYLGGGGTSKGIWGRNCNVTNRFDIYKNLGTGVFVDMNGSAMQSTSFFDVDVTTPANPAANPDASYIL